MSKINVLIVEDEKENTELLLHFIKKYCPMIAGIDQADSVKTALDKINNNDYDLLFLDIILKDKTAFDLLENLTQSPQIIFTTAHEEHAIDSFKYNTIDYLLKPVQIEPLIAAVDRAWSLIEEKQDENRIDSHYDRSSLPQVDGGFIIISNIDKVYLLKSDDISYCKSSGRYTEFHLTDKKCIVASKSLGEYQNQLSPKGFYRVHNSYIINLNHLVSIVKKDGSYCKMQDGTELPISRRKYDNLIKYISIN